MSDAEAETALGTLHNFADARILLGCEDQKEIEVAAHLSRTGRWTIQPHIQFTTTMISMLRCFGGRLTVDGDPTAFSTISINVYFYLVW